MDEKVVILCGGKGTRLREETEFRPKPMVPVGGMPILWHIMKIYSHYGYKNFVLCLGYKGEMIKDYFIKSEWMLNDITIDLKSSRTFKAHGDMEDWTITFVDTGQESLTGERMKKIEKHIKEDYFLATYGDGLADINIKNLVDLHLKMNRLSTLTAINPPSRYGVLDIDNGVAKSFKEKPMMHEWVNGGFFVFKREIFDHLDTDMFENTTLPKLAKMGQLAAYQHKGFWQCMDTYRDFEHLNSIWNSGSVPWNVWKNTR